MSRDLTIDEIIRIEPEDYKRYIWCWNDGQGDTFMDSFDKIEELVKEHKDSDLVTILDILDFIWEVNEDGNMCEFGYIKDDYSLEKVWLSKIKI